MKAAILTPCYQGTVHHLHMLSAIRTFEMARERGVEINHFTAAGCPVLPRVRNRLVADALYEKCDWLVFIDDDIVWEPSDLFKLIEHDVDVVAAAPAKRHARWNEAPSCAVRFPPSRAMEGQASPLEGRHTKAGRIWKVDGLATAFMAIRAPVFKKLRNKAQQFTYPNCNPKVEPFLRNYFWYDIIPATNWAGNPLPDGTKTDLGEDYYFCDLWRSVGGECWVDPDIRLGHYDGNVRHDWCLADNEVKQEQAA